MRLFAKKPAGLDRRRSLALKPVRNSDVHWDHSAGAGAVVLRIPLQRRPAPRLLVWVASKLARQEPPTCRTLELDPVGSFVWTAANGERSVRDLIWLLSAEYKLNRKDAEVALLEFLRQLSTRNLIAFAELPNSR